MRAECMTIMRHKWIVRNSDDSRRALAKMVWVDDHFEMPGLRFLSPDETEPCEVCGCKFQYLKSEMWALISYPSELLIAFSFVEVQWIELSEGWWMESSRSVGVEVGFARTYD
jgi:hypothetical protein